MKHLRLRTELLLIAAAGGLLGVLAQAAMTARVYADGSALGAFGGLTFGFTFWIAVGTALAMRARCGLHAAVRVLCLLIPVLAGYTAGCILLGGIRVPDLIPFGVMMLMPAAAGAWIIRAGRESTAMQVLLLLVGCAAFQFDLHVHASGLRAVGMLAAALVFHCYTVQCAIGRTRCRAAA